MPKSFTKLSKAFLQVRDKFIFKFDFKIDKLTVLFQPYNSNNFSSTVETKNSKNFFHASSASDVNSDSIASLK